jgi:hypothetical protein
MKKKNQKSLELTKKAISSLHVESLDVIKGKGVMSIGRNCTQCGHCGIERWSDGLFCRENNR